MQIVLIRHGKPADVNTQRITGYDIGRWVRHYNTRGITKETRPPKLVRELAATTNYLVTSDLPRAAESAAWIAESREVRSDPELREAGLPESLQLPIRLPPAVWLVLARVAWWFDWCNSEETIQMTRRRADRTANRLIELAAEYGSVMVVGHGTFNRFLAAQLRRHGWRGPKIVHARYWAASRYDRI